MLTYLKQWFMASLRRQLVAGIALVVASTMSLFIWDLTARQQNVVKQQQSQQAIALAQSVATSASVWVASRDFSGLQEIVDGLKHYPDLQHAIVLDSRGYILAHTEVSRRGYYLTDLPPTAVQTLMVGNKNLFDVATPITIAGNHIGWVRVGLGLHSLTVKLDKITRDGIIYILITVVLSILLVLLAVRHLTSRLYEIQTVADAVQNGKLDLRTDVAGTDEAAQLSRQFNEMLDTLARREEEIIRSHDALQQSESRLNQIMDATGEGIWDWDITSQTVGHNLSWCNILGLGEDKITHAMSEFSSLIHKDDVDAVMARVQSCLDGNGAYFSEHRMIKSDGSVIWVQDRGDVAERDADGQPTRMLGSMAAITIRKQAEDKLKHINEELEERVILRTAQVTAARDEAERASAAKSEFLSRMSHELRTPLNAILGFGQLLITDPEHPLTELQAENTQEILMAGQHLLELVNEVLELSRIESGRLDINLQAVDACALINATVSQMRPLAEQRQISMRLQQTAAVNVVADRLRLHEVLINVLSNAVKYNREGGDITIVTTVTRDNHLRISISDTGLGIKKENLNRLFRPFERFESAYNAIEGTGIGLALTQKLLAAMHTEIKVESVYGEGSRFWFELPVCSDDMATEKPSSDNNSLLFATGKRRVIYVEDNLANMLLMRKIIATQKDIELIEAVDAEQGLELIRQQPPGLVFLDINLPGMNGFEALKELQNDALTADIPVIAVTANAMKKDVEEGKKLGFVEYVTKPVDVKNILAMLEHYLPYEP
ncbi:MAG: ATP-binding protein [Gammaproteobacteria bacterium]|nr:ATP-binding protein [Gammaproteobacteria bacterium]